MADDHQAEKPKSLFEIESEVLKFWQTEKIFEKTLEQTKDAEPFVFYDGPPFITGTPHYGTLLPSIAKDIIPRYQTMKGKYVRRVWGWDVHGLPAENQVEKQLGLKGKKDIEELGVDKFVEACRQYVADTSKEWDWYIDHIGRWADMKNAYRTDQLSFMESVMAVFKQLYDKKLIYRGKRVSLYCPRCATPLSKFEITMDEGNYKDVEDPAVTVKFKLEDENVYLLAWTTTPWTLPANLGLAVDEQAEYVRVTDGREEFILAHEALQRFDDLEIIKTFKGKELVGKKYQPLYQFFPANEHDYKVYAGKFVTMNEGTGIVHIAPGFGEDDTELGNSVGLSLFETINAEGLFVDAVKDWAGQYYKKANPLITKDLIERNLLYKEETITHSYPHCYRCGTPLIYKAQVSWYLKISQLRAQLLEQNKKINWVPKHFGDGRFAYNLENAPDWSISRTRYWGSPIPVWETEDGEVHVVGSLAELEKLSGKKVTDLHRPIIDDVEITLPNGKKAKRVKEVLDCWFESGAMPYAQLHYPIKNATEFERNFPADFIIEYTGQLRGWFYYLHVLGQALLGENAFKNVVVTGVLQGTDGRKMSKSYGNYPDPKTTIEKFGGEALRLYFMSSKVMQGEDPAISEEEIKEQSRLIQTLHNSFKYYQTYSDTNAFKPEENFVSKNILDKWINDRLQQFMQVYSTGLDQLDFAVSTRAIRPFIEDLSTWYIRRSRDRFVSGDKEALNTMHNVLNTFCLAVAPTLPFSADYIYRQINRDATSVHLQDYPEFSTEINEKLLEDMVKIRELASVGNKMRADSKIGIRQPLSAFESEGNIELKDNLELLNILKDELNVHEIVLNTKETKLNTQLTPQLIEEGRYRELVRSIQDARKKHGLKVGEKVRIDYFTEDEELLKVIEKRNKDLCKTVGANQISKLISNPENAVELDKISIKFS